VIWVALAAAIAWAVLLGARGMFWLAADDDRDAPHLPEPEAWPAVAVIVPARDEAQTIAATVASLVAQDYPVPLRLVVVDDRSSDGTAELARAAAGAAGESRLLLVQGGARPPGWSGKLNALRQGLAAVAGEPHTHILLTDADIVHDPDSLRLLVRRALAHQLDLVSLMARLRCDSPAERWLIPAFVWFFAMLYPFRWSNDPGARTAAAAGGCVLLRRAALEGRGGLAPIAGRIIDDCALARLIKHGDPSEEKAARGRIWIGLTERVHSLRAYPDVAAIRAMVARTAYAQLGYSPALLAGMVAAMGLVFLAPPLLTILGHGWAQAIGALAWGGMALGFAPMLRRFGLSPWRGLALPLVAGAYLLFTLDSARAEWQGRGGLWKGEPLAGG
jgi:hopene-associated glycosyltransferase HpnB